MKDYAPALTRLVFAAACGVACFAPGNILRAQSTAPNGAYGFVVGVSQIDSAGNDGGALVGTMNFDEEGHVTGTATLKLRNTDAQQAQAVPSTFTGTYSSNGDGTGSVALTFDVGFSATLAVVATENGHGFQLLQTNCSPCATDSTLSGDAASLTGELPAAFLSQNAAGNVSLSLKGIPRGITTVYTLGSGSGSGTAQCDDGSTGDWTASMPAAMFVVNPNIAVLASDGGNVAGNFLLSVSTKVCGASDFGILSGLITGTVSPGGRTSLILHAAGAVTSGIARVSNGGALNGAYGFQLKGEPFPGGSVGVATFDGAGNVTVSMKTVGVGLRSALTSSLSGTYSLNTDGTGTMSLNDASGQPGAAFAFVVTDEGSQLLLLRTDNDTGFDVAFGSARKQ